MCWNPTISLNTFIFALSAIVIGQIAKTHTLDWSLFYMSIASMQLLEYFMWTYASVHNNGVDATDLNSALSVVGLLIIFLQPVAAGFLIKHRQRRAAYFAMYAVWVAAYLALSMPSTSFTTTVAPNGHLQWNWLAPGSAWLIATWVAFIVTAICLSDHGHSTLFLAAIVAFNIAFVAGSYVMHRKSNAWGSVYCSFINVMFVVVLVRAFAQDYCSSS